MSGHSDFAPIGNNAPVVRPLVVGGTGNVSNHQPQQSAPVLNPPPGQQVVEQPNVPNARSLAQKLDSLLMKAANMSAKAVDKNALREATQNLGLSKAEMRALGSAISMAKQTMDDISSLTGREIGSAFVADAKGVFNWKDNDAAKVISQAIDAQARLSELLHNLANKTGVPRAAANRIFELALQCDRRQSEILTLSMDLADAVARNGNDPEITARLDAQLSKLLPRQVMTMHGNADILEKLKAKLQPLADRLESFANRPNAALSSEEFLSYAAEVKAAYNAIHNVAVNGFPSPDGMGRILPDRDFVASLTTLVKAADQQLKDVRKNIGTAVIKHFLDNTITVPKSVGITNPPIFRVVDGNAPALARAIRTRIMIKNAALEYMADPTSEAKMNELFELVDQYATYSQSELQGEIAYLQRFYNDILDAEGWQKLSGVFESKPATLVTQVANFLNMMKNVQETMTDEQFLTTSSARALLDGKISFSTLVEARINGVTDKDIDPALDDSNLDKSETLGSGKVNTVKLVTYKNGTQYVFKPEAPGRQAMENLTLSKDYVPSQQVAQLNLATQSTAKVLGVEDVMPKCSVGVHSGEYGLFMEKVKGLEASDFSKGKAMPDGGLSINDVKKLPPEQHAKVIGDIMRGINRLEWLDLITGQGDRHSHNYMIYVGKDLTVSVKGIDNDACFPAYRKGLRKYVLKGQNAKEFMNSCNYIIANYPKGRQAEARNRLFRDPGVQQDDHGNIVIDTFKFQAGELHFAARRAVGMHGAVLPDYIDAELYAQLISLKSGEKREAYLADLANRLPKKAVDSTRRRLDEAIAYAEQLFKDGKVINKEDFRKQAVQKSLAGREINAGNPVKPVGNYQLPKKSSGDVRLCIVTQAKRQTSTLFIRDLYGKVNKPDWFKQ